MFGLDRKKLNAILGKLTKRPKPWLRRQPLTASEILWVCSQVEPILAKEPTLIQLPPPITIVGDLHGQFEDLLEVFDRGGKISKTRYLFLGDYVDRGNNSVEVVTKLFALKIKYPDNIFLLRGNHETENLSSSNGFLDEIRNKALGNVWFTFNAVFNQMSLAAVVGKRIFCVHGGLSPHLSSLDQIQKIKKPIEIPMTGLICDMLWSDPSEDDKGFQPNTERGISVTYGSDVVHEFLDKNKLDILCRAHQVSDGIWLPYNDDSSCITVFTAASQTNQAAILFVGPQLQCDFNLWTPEERGISTSQEFYAYEEEEQKEYEPGSDERDEDDDDNYQPEQIETDSQNDDSDDEDDHPLENPHYEEEEFSDDNEPISPPDEEATD